MQCQRALVEQLRVMLPRIALLALLVPAHGFFAPASGRARLPPVLSAAPGAGQAVSWRAEYKAFVNDHGLTLCGNSWKGFEALGRGAIYANHDARPPASTYVPLGRWLDSLALSADDPSTVEAVVEYIRGYDPEMQFVVVFQYGGVLGADVVCPNMRPPEVALLPEFAAAAAARP